MILEVVRNDFFGKTTVDSEKQRISARRTGRKIISIKASCSQMGIGCFPNKKILRNSPCLPACKQKNIATRLRDTT